jgi:hypothetical protein
LDTRLDTEEAKITALQTLTANHTDGIASNTNNIASLDVDLFTEQQKTTALQTLTANYSTDIASLDTRLDTEKPKTTALQTLTSTHTDDIALNTADILTKQDLITSSTALECNSLTTGDLEVNGGVNIITKPHFDTIVFRRPSVSHQINLGEIQCWVGGVNILPPNTNDLIGYFDEWSKDNSYPSGDLDSRLSTGQVFKAYNNALEVDFGAHSQGGG